MRILKILISSTKSTEKSIQRVNDLNKEIVNLPNSEKEYVSLKREFIQSEMILNYLIKKKNETEIIKEGTEPDHRIVDTAGKNDSEIPVSPRRKMSYLIGLLFGISIPVVIVSLEISLMKLLEVNLI